MKPNKALKTASSYHFVFYANASSTIGAGHIMRLFALGQVCVAKRIRVSFASAECPDHLREKLVLAGFTFIQLPAAFNAIDIENLKATVLIIDDYHISDTQWRHFIASGALLVNVDDNTHQHPLLGDIIVNASATANTKAYEIRAPHASFCLGPQFALLRQEFVEQSFTLLKQRTHILITLGAADVKNMTYPLAASLIKCIDSSIPITLLLGGLQSQDADLLQALCNAHNNLELVEQSASVAMLMMRSGLAISAAGGTLSELASMGTPTIALVSVDNQESALLTPQDERWYSVFDVREYCADDAKYCEDLLAQISAHASELWRDDQRRQKMSEQALRTIDGKGCERVVEVILNAL